MTEEQKRELEEAPVEQAQEAEVAEKEPTLSPVEVTQEAEEQGEVDELASLCLELEEAQTKQAEYLDGWQRARAELSNARKRFKREQEQAYTNAKGDVLARLLPIVDDFERAFETLPDNLSSLTWVDGVRLIQHKFQVLLEQEGVTPIEAIGQEFDPFLHQAVTHEPSEEVPAHYVIGELQKGYKVGDRVLRPSVVRVSSGPSPEPEPEEGAEPAKEAETEIEEQS